jgi:hypothetical protein
MATVAKGYGMGHLQPLVVQHHATEPGAYEIIAGYPRFTAAELADGTRSRSPAAGTTAL